MKKILTSTFLFANMSEEEIEKIIATASPEKRCFSRGDEVYSSATGEGKVGFILSGRCEVRHAKADGAAAVLNILGESDSFGILSVFSDGEFPTQIFATKNCEILFFSRQEILNFVNNSSQIAMNLVVFLANRVSFLNEKIATFSGTRVEDRLASYLLFEAKKHDFHPFSLNCKKCSEAINAGRASVYRALSSLEAEGAISIVDKKIYINDRKGLERNSK